MTPVQGFVLALSALSATVTTDLMPALAGVICVIGLVMELFLKDFNKK